jgi:hypothetical protein
MRKVLRHFTSYTHSTFNLNLWLGVIVLLIGVITFDYQVGFEQFFVKDSYNSLSLGLYHGVLSLVFYLLVCLLIAFFGKKKDFLGKKGFWLSTLFLFFILGVYRSNAITYQAGTFALPGDLYYYLFKVAGNIEDVLFGVLPFVVLYWFYDKRKIGHCYGIRIEGVDFKPYFWMLLIMAVPIFLVSFTADFKEAYPKGGSCRYEAFATAYQLKNWQALGLFELFYLTSFLAVEIMFRGYLIFRMEKYLGDYVVYPMMVVYAILHFGKPLGETLGSIGGAYVLGILALRTRNIYGGIFIHIGVAALMELFAFLNA